MKLTDEKVEETKKLIVAEIEKSFQSYLGSPATDANYETLRQKVETILKGIGKTINFDILDHIRVKMKAGYKSVSFHLLPKDAPGHYFIYPDHPYLSPAECPKYNR